MNIKNSVSRLEHFLFGHRRAILVLFALFTALMGWFAWQLRMEAGFDKQIPVGHEYTKTSQQFRLDLPGANRLSVVVRARHGTIWNPAALSRLYDVTQAVIFLPNIDRLGVQSLWTPNVFVNEITEDGFRAEPLISATVLPTSLDAGIIERIHTSAQQGGFIGSIVSRDQSSAMITAEINELDAQGLHLDYVAYNQRIEHELRTRFEDADFEVQVIGFAKQMGDIAEGGRSVIVFFGIALLLTLLAVYWYCHSWRLAFLPVLCSLTSLVWQFGTLRLMGYGLDPLAVLVPFLVFAIGVSHGVQQINFIVRGLSNGKSAEQAARDSFTGLLIPGMLALLTALLSFLTLLLVPIPMIRELAIVASLGVGYKILTNLIMLPVICAGLRVNEDFVRKSKRKREQRARIIQSIAVVAQPRVALAVVCITVVVLGVSVWGSRDRIVGTLQAGAPELRPESRFNRDAVAIAANFDLGQDWLTVVLQAPPGSCEDTRIGRYMDELVGRMSGEPGVTSSASYSGQLRNFNQGYNEGLPKMDVVPVDQGNYSALSAEISRVRGFNSKDCSMTALHLYLSDHKASTLKRVLAAIRDFSTVHALPSGIVLRLAAGNAGVLAATNEELERSELPMLLYVYGAIIALVLLVYRDVRAAIACCLPLTVATFIGYWFMKHFEIGLTVATLPVMVLAVGIGVDYALYIYNRLQMHLADGASVRDAMGFALEFEGMATIFTALTLAIGVATWSFSALKFQADMGKLLAFMFIVNLVMAFTALPALAVVLERVFPRRRPAYTPSILTH